MAKITLKGNPLHTSGELPKPGTDLSGLKVTKSDLSDATLAAWAGHKLVLNIFPSIDTSVCSQSVRQFNKEAAGLSGVHVLCVSMDLPFALNRFCGAEGIKNVQTASAFRNPDFSAKLGVKIIDGGMAGLLARSIVVLDEHGKVIYTELVPEIAQEPNYQAALAAAR
jgi:thiol peroxidase